MRTVVEVDLAAEEIKKVLLKLQADRKQTEADIEQAKKSRQAHALAALTGNTVEESKLKKSHASMRDLEFALEDNGFALDECRRQLAQLGEEREQAVKHEAEEELEKLTQQALDTARFMDHSIIDLAQLVTEHHAQLRKLTALSTQAGRPRIFALKHFWRCLNAAMHGVLPSEFPSQHAFYKNKSYEALLLQQIENASAVEPDEQAAG